MSFHNLIFSSTTYSLFSTARYGGTFDTSGPEYLRIIYSPFSLFLSLSRCLRLLLFVLIACRLSPTHRLSSCTVSTRGTFGYSKTQLALFDFTNGVRPGPIEFDTSNHGTSGGDNFGEGQLDVSMISSFGLGATTVVSNTNTSSSTEEGDGFGEALLLFLTSLAQRKAEE